MGRAAEACKCDMLMWLASTGSPARRNSSYCSLPSTLCSRAPAGPQASGSPACKTPEHSPMVPGPLEHPQGLPNAAPRGTLEKQAAHSLHWPHPELGQCPKSPPSPVLMLRGQLQRLLRGRLTKKKKQTQKACPEQISKGAAATNKPMHNTKETINKAN